MACCPSSAQEMLWKTRRVQSCQVLRLAVLRKEKKRKEKTHHNCTTTVIYFWGRSNFFGRVPSPGSPAFSWKHHNWRSTRQPQQLPRLALFDGFRQLAQDQLDRTTGNSSVDPLLYSMTSDFFALNFYWNKRVLGITWNYHELPIFETCQQLERFVGLSLMSELWTHLLLEVLEGMAMSMKVGSLLESTIPQRRFSVSNWTFWLWQLGSPTDARHTNACHLGNGQPLLGLTQKVVKW